MKKILIEWKRYAKKGKTCERCTGTGNNLHRVIAELKKEFQDKDIDLQLKETVLPKSKIPESNIILIDGMPIENVLPNAFKGESECCSCGDLCGSPTDCRTVTIGGKTYEEIPASIIKQAIFTKLAEPYYSTLKKGEPMKIQVFGPGCDSCKKLYEVTKTAVSELGIKSEVEYITDIGKMSEMGFITSPVLAIGGKAVVSGFVPNLDQLKQVIKKSQLTSKDGCCGGGCSCGGNC